MKRLKRIVPENMGKRSRISKEFVDANSEQVMKLAQLGCTDKEISHVIDMCETTLEVRFRKALDIGRSHLRQAIRKAQIQLAVGEKNPTMLVWLGKNYLSQREPKQKFEHSGDITVEKVMFYQEEAM